MKQCASSGNLACSANVRIRLYKLDTAQMRKCRFTSAESANGTGGFTAVRYVTTKTMK